MLIPQSNEYKFIGVTIIHRLKRQISEKIGRIYMELTSHVLPPRSHHKFDVFLWKGINQRIASHTCKARAFY
jgi:hypothetical protein